MAAVAIQFAAAGNAGWTPGFSLEITGFQVCASTGTTIAVLSFDEAVSQSSFQTPTTAGIDRNIIAYGMNTVAPATFPAVPVTVGQSVFVSAKAACSAIIYYRPLEP